MGISPHEMLIARLRDAHRMETEGLGLLAEHLEELSGLPDWRGRLEQHVAETEQHRARVERCLIRLDSEPSTSAGGAAITADMHGMLRPFTDDDVMRQALRGYTFEVFEAGAYRLLAALAARLDEPEIAHECEEMIKQEEEMGRWIWAQLPQLTVQFLTKESLRSVINHPPR